MISQNSASLQLEKQEKLLQMLNSRNMFTDVEYTNSLVCIAPL